MGMLVPPSRMTESGIQMNCQNDAQLRATVVVVAIASGASGAVASIVGAGHMGVSRFSRW
jgi:hypothetical protein